jgi:GR25 family glycosyltransferase involved in LPS biosynthesis
MKRIDVYLINLESERKRLEHAYIQATNQDFKFVRIPAVSKSKLMPDSSPLVTDGVAAAWNSHMSALETFLGSDASHALILEDDFEIQDSNLFEKYLSLNNVVNWDLFQLGFLITGPDVWLSCWYKNLEAVLFKKIGYISLIRFLRLTSLQNRLRVKTNLGVARGIVTADFMPGAHAYIISRKIAKIVLDLNSPQFLSVDDFFIAFSKMRIVNTARLSKSIVGQAKFPTGISSRFINSPW